MNRRVFGILVELAAGLVTMAFAVIPGSLADRVAGYTAAPAISKTLAYRGDAVQAKF